MSDKTDVPWDAPDHITKDAHIEALTAEASELPSNRRSYTPKMTMRTREINENDAQLKTISEKKHSFGVAKGEDA